MDENRDPNIGHLFMHIARLLASRADRSLDKFGLYRGQAGLLMMLSDREGLTHSEIAEKLEISPAAATKVIKRLETLNYLQRRADPSDERVSRVFLKEEGWAVIHQIKSVFHQNNLILRSALSAEEQALMINLLKKIHSNLQKPPVESV